MEQVTQRLVEDGLCTKAVPKGRYVETDRGQVFVKIGTGGAHAELEILQYEALGLEHLHKASNTIRVPKPWVTGTLQGGSAFIVMDYIPLKGRGRIQHHLGQGLAEIHLADSQHKTYGFPMDGCCGACTQLNNPEGRQMTWPEFWQEYRLGHQLAMAKQNYPSDTALQHKGAQVMKTVPDLFSMLVVEDIRCSLLHGDLWSGNYSSDDNEQPVIFDPAAYYGHDEADLGIARMFGGFSQEFWSAYHQKIPKRPGFARRALLYELHHHLNHYNIFGSGYRSGALSLMDAILVG